MTNPPATATRPEGWAEVRAHDQVMRYHRTGAGRAVVLVRAADGSHPPWPELLDALGDGFRLIAPEVPAGGDVAAWLSRFLEGLGVARVAVVAAEPYCLPALELALLDADRVGHVVLVAGGPAAQGGLAGMVATSCGERPLRLLVVRRALAAPDVLPGVLRFLADDGIRRSD